MRLSSLLALGALLTAPLATTAASAQPTIGLKAGLNTAFFSGDDANNSDPRLGFVGGLTARVPVNPSIAFQVEALYSQKGERFENSAGFDEVTKLSYLEVPASLRFGVPLSPLLDAGVSVGGYVGVPLDGSVEVDGVEGSDLDLRTDYGALIGVDVGSGPVYVEGRYTLGLAEAIEFDPGIDEFDLDKKNQVVSFTIGYRFGGGTAPRRRY